MTAWDPAEVERLLAEVRAFGSRDRQGLRDAMADQLEAALAEVAVRSTELAMLRQLTTEQLAIIEADRAEAATTYEGMRAELEALRCGDVDAYFHGELSPERRAAFERHQVRCATCQRELGYLMQLARIADAPKKAP